MDNPFGTAIHVIESNSHRYKIKLGHWSHSQDSAYRKCLLRWFRSAVLGMKAKRQANALVYGLTIHYALQQFHAVDPQYRTEDILLTHADDYLTTTLDSIDDDEAAAGFRDWYRSIGEPTLKQIWSTYGQDEGIPKLTQTELTLHVPIPNTDGVLYETRLDALIMNVAEPFIFETKTMGQDRRKDYDFYDLQAPRNIWAVNEALQPLRPVRKLMYNFVVFPAKTRNGLLSRSVYEPSDAEILWAIHDIPSVVQEATRDGLVIYPTFGRDCAFSCEFAEICQTAKLGGDIEPLIEERYTLRDSKPGEVLDVKSQFPEEDE